MYIIPFVAQAAEKKKDAFEFTEAWGVTIASAVTVLGMILAAWIAYRAGRRQVADQGLIEHRHWRRQNRLEAYKQFMVATDGVTEALTDWLTTRNTTNVRQAVVALGAAKAEVMLSGPESMHSRVIKVNAEAAKFYAYLSQRTIAIPVPTQLWRQKYGDVAAAQSAFVAEAAKVLDNPDL
ncbi:hypothetical protein ACFU67_12925 [Streptomyces rhizosphaericola]|uniref:hypothetical protein n=1 Tax=Streptomyces rhizosphaericola TaxID=2564098 RepID=UPI0036972467